MLDSISMARRTQVLLASFILLLPALAMADSLSDHPFYPVVEDAVARSVMRDLVEFRAPGDACDHIACVETADYALCVHPDTPYEEMQKILRNLPTGSEFDQDRYWRYTRWVNTAHGSTGQLGEPITLTYSVIPDGTYIGGQQSNLQAVLTSQFGDEETWRQIMADCFADWASHAGLTYIEVGDDGAPFPGSAGQLGSRGDVRIGGVYVDGPSGTLAYNYYPDGGDMVMDTAENWAQGNLRFIRNVIMHEHGHGMGLGHTTPTNNTKLMEAFLNTNFLGPQEDDVRGGCRNYGDPFEEDDDAGSANDLGTWEMVEQVLDHNLDYVSDVDWFEFHTIATSEVDITLDPIGSYQQLGHEGGPPPSWYHTDEMMDLGFKLYDSDLNELAYVEDVDHGENEVLQDYIAEPGTYYIEVLRDASSIGADVQRYNLLIWITITDPTDVDVAEVPAGGLDASVFPNPFNPKTTVRFYAPDAGEAQVDVYDMGGHRVEQLSVRADEAGWVQVDWNGRNSAGEPAASGIYLMKIRCGQLSQTVRAVLLK